MLLEEPLDLRHAGASVDPIDDPLLLHEHERRDLLHGELPRKPRVAGDIDAADRQAPALLAFDVGEEAFHATRGPGSIVVEEHELRERDATHPSVLPGASRGKTARLYTARLYTGRRMWEIYRIGLCAGGGVAVGLLIAALATRFGLPVVAAVAAAASAVVAGFVFGWLGEAIGGGAGGLLGGAGAATVACGALRRGGTPAGTAVLLVLAAAGALALAFIPLVGYLEALALPVLAARTRRRGGEKYAGLRSLAR